jgi:hypothetical protein
LPTFGRPAVDVYAGAQQASLPALRQHRVERLAHACETRRRILRVQRVDLFFGKVEHRLDQGAQFRELRDQHVDGGREFPGERAQR